MTPNTVETMTWETLDKIKGIYNAAGTDDERIYQINNAMSVLSALHAFLVTKRDVMKQDGKADGKTDGNGKVIERLTEKTYEKISECPPDDKAKPQENLPTS